MPLWTRRRKTSRCLSGSPERAASTWASRSDWTAAVSGRVVELAAVWTYSLSVMTRFNRAVSRRPASRATLLAMRKSQCRKMPCSLYLGRALRTCRKVS